jgi:hypothetical protein
MDMKELYSMLPIGQSNAIHIDSIAMMWGMSERRAREIIEQMWYNNMPVCNLRSGYFRPESVEDIEAYRKIIHSYKCKFNNKERRVRLAAEQFENERMEL